MSLMEELSLDHSDFRLQDPSPAFTVLLADPAPVTINCGVEEVGHSFSTGNMRMTAYWGLEPYFLNLTVTTNHLRTVLYYRF